MTLTGDARRALDEGFGDGPDGEDCFDAFVGLIGMLNIVLGHRDPGPPSTVPPEVIAVEGWMLGHGAPQAAPPPVAPLERLASLLGQRNAVDADIASVIGRPAVVGHIGEFIAAEVFDIDLERSATRPGYDGVFRSGPLAGATVNIKFYGKREGLLDIPPSVPRPLPRADGPPVRGHVLVGWDSSADHRGGLPLRWTGSREPPARVRRADRRRDQRDRSGSGLVCGLS